MKKHFLRSFLVIGLLVSLGSGYTPTQAESAAKPSKTIVLAPEAGHFSVIFPKGFSAVQQAQRLIPTQMGNLTLNLYASETPTGACMVSYNDYPMELEVEKMDIQKLLDASENGGLTNMHATLESHQDIKLKGYPGRRLYFHATEPKSGKPVYGRFDYYLVKSRMFQLGFISPSKNEVKSSNTQSFFTSFKLKG